MCECVGRPVGPPQLLERLEPLTDGRFHPLERQPKPLRGDDDENREE